jgi:hypothetical protein
MNPSFRNTAIRHCVVIGLLGWASMAFAGKPTSVAHPTTVTVIDSANAIQSDSPTLSNASYTEGVALTAARLWEFTNFSHLNFEVQKKKGRFLRLTIPTVTGGTVTCGDGWLKPNQIAHGYDFYHQLPIGASTNDINENFGGTFRCDAWPNGSAPGYFITYPPCIVIEHTGVGYWRMTAPAVGCDALVTVDGVTQAGTYPVPFQLDVDQLDVP